MKNKRVKIDSLLLMLIKENLSNGFTTISIRDEYLKRSLNPTCSKETRIYIYKNILRLMNLGILIKNGDKYSQKTIYTPSSTFDETKFSSIKPFGEKYLLKANSAKIKRPTLNKLESILKKYKVEMLSAIGESEEYIRLSNHYPEMTSLLEEKHQIAFNNSYKFLGKITAIQAIISIQDQIS